jgi:diguanylate cyclase (GGDEF)-like protein/PAS domain S-box-containing protein
VRLSNRARATIAFPAAECLLALALFAIDSAAIYLIGTVGGIALLWPGNAIAAALLIRLPRVRWASAAGLILLATYLADALVAHRPPQVSLLLTLSNGMEIALMVTAFRFVRRYPYPHITVEQSAIMTAVFGVAIPGVCSLAGGAAQAAYGAGFAEGALDWWSSHALGACLLGPPLILMSRKGLEGLVRKTAGEQTVLTALICMGATYFAVRYMRFPFVLIELPLLIAAFRYGGFGTSLFSLCSALTIITLWGFGVRPFGLDRADAADSFSGLPVIALLLTVMPPVAVGLGTDARRALTRALRENERHFHTALEHSPIGMLVADLNGIWGYTNRALQKMLGYTAEEFRALPPGGPSMASDWQESTTRWGRLLTGEIEYYEIERRFQHKNGAWIWAHVAVSLLRDANGAPSGLISQIESLETRLRAEERLAEQREKLRTMLQAISDAVITTDAERRITYVNHAAEALLGVSQELVSDHPIEDALLLRDPSSSRSAVNLIAKVMATGKSIRRDSPCALHLPDGNVCYVTDVVSPVLDATGRVIGTVIVFRDATDDMVRERELRHSALHDALTGLYTRAEFQRRLRNVFEKATQLGRMAAVIAIDLDRFKQVNDAAGHAGGDAVLCKVADALRGVTRTTDTVARLGGDEFAILLDECPAERALVVGRKVAAALNPLQVVLEAKAYSVGASLGIALWSPELASERDWLIAADKACYAAKAKGDAAPRLVVHSA